jgi:tRNA 2-thiouridine synthesizing protein A
VTNKPIIVDARGHRCPVPSLRLRKAIAEHRDVEAFRLLATDPMARIDVPYLMAELGGRVLSVTEDAGEMTITVERHGAPKD